MNHNVAIWSSITILLASCANVESVHSDATVQLHTAVAERTGFDAAAKRGAPEASILSAVQELLRAELTEESAVRIALLNNRKVRAGYERLGIAAADLVQAGLLRNPLFSADALWSDGGTEMQLGLAQSFVDMFWRPLRKRRAEHELDAAIAAVTRDLVQLTFEVRRGFVRVRAAQQLVASQRRILAAAKVSHELMQQLSTAGNVVGAQLSAARVAEGRARLELAAAERAEREAREPLNVLLGLWGQRAAWRIGGELAAVSFQAVELDDVEARSIDASLELRENRARIDAAAQGVRFQSWSRWLPDAAAGAAAQRGPGGDWAFGPSLTMELPILDWGAAKTAAAESHMRLLLHRQTQIAVATRAAARLLRERVELLDQRSRFLLHEFLPAQERLLLDTLQNYNAMQIGAFDVIVQKQQQLTAVREHVTTTRDAWLARLDLEELLAGSQPQGAMTAFWPTPDSETNDTDQGGH